MSNTIFKDPNIALKERDVRINLEYRDGYPIFSLVELNLWGACNRRCSFCPISNPKVFVNKKEGISVSNYQKLLDQLQEIDFKGVILWSMFSEPTLHRSINLLARKTKETLPLVSLQLTSNGDSFHRRPDKLRSLIEAGVDRINLSLYDDSSQLDHFVQLIKKIGMSSNEVKLRRRYLENGNFGITISNRTGLIDSNKYRDTNEAPIIDLPLMRSCFYPFYQVAIDYNGDVLLCPHDWSKQLVAGNAFEENIMGIWKGQKMSRARSELMQKRRSFSPCKSCDVSGDLIGKENFDAFLKLENQ